jgi:hypothetical protein
MYKKSFASKNSYLSNLDLINKYNLPSVYSVPKLQNITVTLSLNNIINACDFKNVLIKDHEIQIKSFLLFYITFLIVPLLKNSKIQLVKASEKNLQMNYILKVTLISFIDINEFLFLVFIENWQQFLLEDNEFFKKNSYTPLNTNFLNFRTQLYLNNLISFQSIFSLLLNNISLKEVPLKLSFRIKINKSVKINNKFNLLKNLPLFWISG